ITQKPTLEKDYIKTRKLPEKNENVIQNVEKMILFRPFHLSLSIFNMIKDSNLVIPLVEIFSHIQLNVIYNPFKYITTDMDYQNSKRHALKNISYMPFHNFCQIHNGKRT
ncbi:hypothetical protein, partial [Streptococcus suis]|uniref:hypothetical protein n=1 Tax=Streptococcus suis TaxID=1307 RepID=UPI001F4228B2